MRTQLHKAIQIIASSFVWFIMLGTSAKAESLRTYVTGDAGVSNVIFKIDFDPAVVDSGFVSVAATHPSKALDGIDFVLSGLASPGEVAVGSPTPPGAVTHFNVFAGTLLPPFVADATSIAPALPPVAAQVSTILTTPSFSDSIYYVENQFGFAPGPHRIVRTSVSTGLEGVVYDGFGDGVVNIEGLEMASDGGGLRLYFFARDTAVGTNRALYSVPLTGGGIASGPAVKHLGGLFAGPGGDGSDELDFDPFTGFIFGSNIRNGEVIAWNPIAGVAITSPGATTNRFIDGSQVAGGAADGLGLLSREVDGIRSTGSGRLIFAGRGGVIGSISIGGVLGDGAGNADLVRIYDSAIAGTGYVFDDLTPLIPEPSTAASLSLGLLLIWRQLRRPHSPSGR